MSYNYYCSNQGILIEGKGSVQLTSSLDHVNELTKALGKEY